MQRLKRCGSCAMATAAILISAGCAAPRRLDLDRLAGGNAALVGQFQAFDGKTGRPISFARAVARCRRADVVLFGEQHNDPVCNQIEAQLLHALAADARPVALAMEFFETDTQSAIDAYFAGRIDEPAFVSLTRQRSSYRLSHRPLIEYCRAAHLPVIAANAPRRLVRAFRQSDLGFRDFRASLPPDDRRWLPTESRNLVGPYRRRFEEATRGHPPVASQPGSAPATQRSEAAERERGFRAQLLWDDSMAESVANFRRTYPAHRVMLVVGRFHVSHKGGTAVKLRQRRRSDRIVTVVYASADKTPFTFPPGDRYAADVVFVGVSATAPAPPAAAVQTTRPSSQPTTAPAPSS